ncbi:hypothetical protein Trydic_g9053 [Trypoxylus dichotomus]
MTDASTHNVSASEQLINVNAGHRTAVAVTAAAVKKKQRRDSLGVNICSGEPSRHGTEGDRLEITNFSFNNRTNLEASA